MSEESIRLRRAYAELCRGYSEAKWHDQVVYVKHLSIFDQTEIDTWQNEAFEHAKRNGIPTEKERLKWLEENVMWTQKQQSEIDGEKSYLDGLRKTKSKAALKAQIDQLNKQLEEGQARLEMLLEKKQRLIGRTAETVAEQKVQYEYIRLSFFTDIEFKKPLFTRGTLHELYDEDMDYLLVTYIEIMSRFGAKSLRSISVQPFFTNQFYLSEHVSDFFGRPIVDLSLNQTNLLSYGQYYRTVFKNHQIPGDIMDDPDQIDEYLTRSANAKKLMGGPSVPESKGMRVGVVGARPEDFAAAGYEDSTAKMHEIAGKGYKDARDVAKDYGYTVVDKR